MKILILGCGWVGEAFAEYICRNDAELWVTTTGKDKADRLRKLGFHTVVMDFDVSADWRLLPSSFDYILTSIPATSKHTPEVLFDRFDRVKTLIDRLDYKGHIFLSSVGIYPDQDGIFDESCISDLNERLYRTEKQLLSLSHTSVYRLGGLFGKNRIFAKYFADKVCHTGDQLANFVHITDVVQLIERGFERLMWGEAYNVVCPEHPSKRHVIEASAAKYGYNLPLAFEPREIFHKVVVPDKIIKLLDYTFKYPSPVDF